MAKEVILQLDSFRDGLAKSIYQGGKNQFAPGTYDIDFFSQPGIIQPVIGLKRDTGDPSTRDIRAVIRASDGTYYWIGTNASGELQVWTGSPGSNTTLSTSGSGNASATNMAQGSKVIEFKGSGSNTYLIFYDSSTDLAKFDIGTPAITLTANGSALTGNTGLDLLIYKSFLYYCNKNKVGRAVHCDSSAGFNDSALTLEDKYRVQTLTGWGNKVVVGAATKNEGGNSKLFIWDGVSTLFDYSVDLPDNGLRAAVNNNGIIYLFCVSNPNGNADINIVRVYAWAGGERIKLIRELNLEATTINSFKILPAAVNSYRGKVYFTINAGTADSMTIDNGVYSIDERGVLNLEYIDASADTSDLSAYFCQWIEGDLFWFFDAGATKVKAHHAGDDYSSNARLDTLAYRFDSRYETRIDEIFFNLVSLPASTSVAVSINTDQAGSGFSAVKTISSGKVAHIINQADYTFQPGHTHQLRFKFTSSSSSRPQIILPIYIKATVFENQMLES